MATDFTTLIRPARPLRMRRAEQIIVPREMEIERQIVAGRYRERPGLWQHPDVRQFTTSFAIFFTGAMVFLV